MYTGKHAHLRPLQPAFIMATSGEAVTYAELEARSNRLAHLLRNLGLKRLDLQEATSGLPKTPIADEGIGTAMLYSSGTTGRPKGILRPLPEQPPERQMPLFDFLQKLWHYREGMIYLSPAPLYHSAPSISPSATAAPPSSWKASIRSAISS